MLHYHILGVLTCTLVCVLTGSFEWLWLPEGYGHADVLNPSDINLFCLNMFGHISFDVDPEGMCSAWHVSGGYIRQHVPPSIILLVMPMVWYSKSVFVVFRRVSYRFVVVKVVCKVPNVINVSFKERRRFLPCLLDWNTCAFLRYAAGMVTR